MCKIGIFVIKGLPILYVLPLHSAAIAISTTKFKNYFYVSESHEPKFFISCWLYIFVSFAEEHSIIKTELNDIEQKLAEIFSDKKQPEIKTGER